MLFEPIEGVSTESLVARVSNDNARELAHAVGGLLIEEIHPFSNAVTYGINVPTFWGNTRASQGDYIFKHGDYYEVLTQPEYLRFQSKL